MAEDRFIPGMGPPPAGFRQGDGPPRKGGGGGPPPMTSPPMQEMPQFFGYEQDGVFEKMNSMPPPPPSSPPSEPSPPIEFTDIANLDEEACRQAMLDHVAEHCCYGAKPAKEMTITHHHGLTAFHYTLETFTEARKTKYKHVPYRGGTIDGPENGTPPAPWTIHCVADSMFDDHVKKKEVPHTATVRPCHRCDAQGYFRCWECHGWGQTECESCDRQGFHERNDINSGHPVREPCQRCHGDGLCRCDKCGGDGRITCDKCDGYRKIKSFIQLVVTYTNNLEEHVIERSDMPDHLIKEVSGTMVSEQVLNQVSPITSYPIPEINENSIRIVNQHKEAFPNKRIVKQRQRLRAVPVTEVHYTWEEVNTRYWIYGLERKVHAPDYPKQCCCGCAIL